MNFNEYQEAASSFSRYEEIVDEMLRPIGRLVYEFQEAFGELKSGGITETEELKAFKKLRTLLIRFYPVLGLGGESGEVLEKTKKFFRDARGEPSEEYKQAIAKELGDVLWYLSHTAKKWDIKLEDIAQQNLDKLGSRKDRGVIHGSGDNR